MSTNTGLAARSRRLAAAVVIVAAFAATGVSGGQVAEAASTQYLATTVGATRYVSFTVSLGSRWGCPSVNSVVQLKLTNVTTTGFNIAALRIYNGTPTKDGAVSINTSAGFINLTPPASAAGFSWGSWKTINRTLKFSSAGVNVAVTDLGVGVSSNCTTTATASIYLQT